MLIAAGPAVTAAFSGNVSGSAATLIQSAAVTALQSLGAQQIKQLSDTLGGEGSAAHTALHAILGCAGAAASGSNCGTAALAAGAGSTINALLNNLDSNLTPEDRENRSQLITTLITGITTATGGDAAIANTASRIETENNAVFVIPVVLELVDKGITAYDAYQLNKAIQEGRTEDAEAIATEIMVGIATGAVPGNKILQKVKKAAGARKAGGAGNIAGGVKLNRELTLDEIVDHSFEKHVLEQGEFTGLGIRTKNQFRAHIDNVLDNPSGIRYYKDGRTAYIQESTRTVVIRNPTGSGQSTAFQPTDWNNYINNVLSSRTTPYQ